MKIKWYDSGREPQCASDSAFPNGKHVDLTVGGAKACRIALPYPVKRIGIYMVSCEGCGLRVGVTTAGRPDDPRSVRMTCISKRRPS